VRDVILGRLSVPDSIEERMADVTARVAAEDALEDSHDAIDTKALMYRS
jgi:hypothetical protein